MKVSNVVYISSMSDGVLQKYLFFVVLIIMWLTAMPYSSTLLLTNKKVYNLLCCHGSLIFGAFMNVLLILDTFSFVIICCNHLIVEFQILYQNTWV